MDEVLASSKALGQAPLDIEAFAATKGLSRPKEARLHIRGGGHSRLLKGLCAVVHGLGREPSLASRRWRQQRRPRRQENVRRKCSTGREAACKR